MKYVTEIVAVKIGTTITNDVQMIIAAIKAGREVEPLSRVRVNFMAACDVGDHWKRLAEAPTLFCLDEEGHPFRKEDEDNDTLP